MVLGRTSQIINLISMHFIVISYVLSFRASADEFILVQFCLEHSCHSSFQQGSHSPKNETFPKLDDGSVSLPMITSKSLCLRKCCPPLQVIDMTSFTCVKQDIPWQLYPLSWNMLPDAKHGSSERSSWEFQTSK